ncbi:MAG TPA: carboxypeptidase-like regulatory domain-containing protein, partial [Pyrinomonadaceae bacterium]
MNRTTSSLVRVMMGGLFLLFVLGTANAQFKAGIQGTVTDTAGGLVPDAKITLVDTETGKTQETTSSNEGFYRLSGLAPAKYKLTVEKTGYKQKVFDNLAV